MHKPSINIIGCGRLGKTIIKLLLDRELISVQGIINSTYENTKQACAYLNSGTPYHAIDQLPPADIYLITTKDDLIKDIAASLHAEGALKSGAIVAHCSGSLTSDELQITKASGCYTASLHPIKSFANPELAHQTFSGTYCAIEGDSQACDVLKSLVEKIGGNVFSLEKAHKKIYHAGGVMANNYLVTLHSYATQCYVNAGIDSDIAKGIVSMLMQDGLSNLAKLSHQDALTGPLQRGDIDTIQQHLSALESTPEIKKLYTILGRAALALTLHTDKEKQQLLKLLA